MACRVKQKKRATERVSERKKKPTACDKDLAHVIHGSKSCFVCDRHITTYHKLPSYEAACNVSSAEKLVKLLWFELPLHVNATEWKDVVVIQQGPCRSHLLAVGGDKAIAIQTQTLTATHKILTALIFGLQVHKCFSGSRGFTSRNDSDIGLSSKRGHQLTPV